jgi:predicted phage terminase large subunit-like protein
MKLTRIIFSVDTAFKTGRTNDFSVILIMGEAREGFYVLHVWRARADFPTLKKTLTTLAAEWKPNTILVEDAASGQSLIQDLKDTSLPIKPVKVDADKVTRANAVTGIIEAGRVFLPHAAGWLADFRDEVAAFPSGAHDDQVDALTMALNYLRGAGGWGEAKAFLRALFLHEGRELPPELQTSKDLKPALAPDAARLDRNEGRDRLEVGTLKHNEPSPPRPAQPFVATKGTRYGPQGDEPVLSDTARPNLRAAEFTAPQPKACRPGSGELQCPTCDLWLPGSAYAEHHRTAHGGG